MGLLTRFIQILLTSLVLGLPTGNIAAATPLERISGCDAARDVKFATQELRLHSEVGGALRRVISERLLPFVELQLDALARASISAPGDEGNQLFISGMGLGANRRIVMELWLSEHTEPWITDNEGNLSRTLHIPPGTDWNSMPGAGLDVLGRFFFGTPLYPLTMGVRVAGEAAEDLPQRLIQWVRNFGQGPLNSSSVAESRAFYMQLYKQLRVPGANDMLRRLISARIDAIQRGSPSTRLTLRQRCKVQEAVGIESGVNSVALELIDWLRSHEGRPSRRGETREERGLANDFGNWINGDRASTFRTDIQDVIALLQLGLSEERLTDAQIYRISTVVGLETDSSQLGRRLIAQIRNYGRITRQSNDPNLSSTLWYRRRGPSAVSFQASVETELSRIVVDRNQPQLTDDQIRIIRESATPVVVPPGGSGNMDSAE